MSVSLCDRFAHVARRDRDRLAIYAPSEKQYLTFGGIQDLHAAIGAAIDTLPVASDGAVVSSVGNVATFVPLVLACASRRRPLILLDGTAGVEQATSVARRFGASAVFVPGHAAETSAEVIPMPGGLAALPVSAAGEPAIDGSAAIIKMTSGSGSAPKGVRVSEAALIHDAEHIIDAMDLRQDDVNIAVIPLAHSYGFSNLVLPLLLQGTAMVLRSGFLARQLLGDIARFNATVLPAVPFIFDYLIRVEGGTAPLSRLRLAISAGAPIESGTVETYARRCGRKIHSFYGTSETGGITFDASVSVTEPIAVGRPLPGTTVTLVPASETPGAASRVLVEGEALGSGYVGETASPDGGGFTNGGFLTGDLARWDAAGRLILTGRTSRFVNIAGRKVHSAEVERVIVEATGASGVLVLGVPWPSRGEVMVACVRNAGRALDSDVIRARCVERLPAHMVPRSVLLLDEFPVDVRGKLDRETLLRLAVESIARD